MCDGFVVASAARDGDGIVYVFDAHTGEEVRRLLPEPGLDLILFGDQLACGGGVIVIGASGGVQIHNAETGQFTGFVPALPGFTQFSDVAAGAGHIALGLESYPDFATRFGAVFIVDAATAEVERALMTDPTELRARFGSRVAMHGNRIVASDWQGNYYGSGYGAAYLFRADSGEQEAKLQPSSIGLDGSFGFAVAASEEFVVVGAPYEDFQGRDSGSAYLFDAQTGEFIARLLPRVGYQEARFGASVAIDGRTIVVGAPREVANGVYAGGVHVFNLPDPFCGSADIAEPYGALTPADMVAFATSFVSSDGLADVAPPYRSFDRDDVVAFVEAFTSACP